MMTDRILPDGKTVVRRAPKPTWAELVKAEPKLGELLAEAQAVKDDGRTPSFCANRIWYAPGGFKDRLCRLVGWDRKGHPVLGTMQAYDVAYETIYDALPDCRDCWCL
jgi:hypothetical protein